MLLMLVHGVGMGATTTADAAAGTAAQLPTLGAGR
jgi:hypothetical protein